MRKLLAILPDPIQDCIKAGFFLGIKIGTMLLTMTPVILFLAAEVCRVASHNLDLDVNTYYHGKYDLE